MLAMQRAVAGLHIAPEYVLIDGNRCPKLPMPSMAVVKGDSRVPEISAASILAKVTRDAEMAELDIIYPQYGFAQHKGYPTAFHLENWLNTVRPNTIGAALALSNAHWDLRPDSCVEIK